MKKLFPAVIKALLITGKQGKEGLILKALRIALATWLLDSMFLALMSAILTLPLPCVLACSKTEATILLRTFSR